MQEKLAAAKNRIKQLEEQNAALAKLSDASQALGAAKMLGRRSRDECKRVLLSRSGAGGHRRVIGSLRGIVSTNLTRWVEKAGSPGKAELLISFLREAAGLPGGDAPSSRVGDKERRRLARLVAIAAASILQAIQPSYKWNYGWLMQLAMRKATGGSPAAARLVQGMLPGTPSYTGLKQCAPQRRGGLRSGPATLIISVLLKTVAACF